MRLPTVRDQPAFFFICDSTYFHVRPRLFLSFSPPFFETQRVRKIPQTEPIVAAMT